VTGWSGSAELQGSRSTTVDESASERNRSMAKRGSGPLSRVVHLLDRISSRPSTAALIGGLVLGFLIALAVAGFPTSWQTAFATGCAAVTTVMVFTIQHTQSREQAATQLKLDELIRALPTADDHLVHVEAGADEELAELERRHLEHHVSVREND
jgi:low affinity Fe/Cu permease